MTTFNRNHSDCPCRGCEKRELGCHGKCEAYKVWAQKQEAMRKVRFDMNNSLFTYGPEKQRKWWKDMKYGRNKKWNGRD